MGIFHLYQQLDSIAQTLVIDAKHLSSEGVQRLKELFAEAYEITAFIADDKESLDMLTQFGKDYAGAQSSIEWAEFAGGGVFEIVLTALLLMFTGGVGNVAQGASKIRHAGKLKSLGSIFRSLGKLLKRKKLRKKVRVNVDTKKPVKTELPEGKKPSVKPIKKMDEHKPKCFKPGDALKEKFKDDPQGMEKEFYRQLKAQEEGINKMSVGTYLQNRQTLQQLTEQHGHSKARAILTNGGKAQQDARDDLAAKMKESIKESLRKKI
ncbi:polymorphic toxin type 15 domain-containing protein [Cellvibrio sp. QJXJ]|uniref:polymorphic toxin type 15 domain-containing protein n=1 Tax=Cellvibrio sp. QJXJ TaxID=2964606 RepID=UPI0021C392F1|nr:polymorphic toxin type 15 domain-containing protein [Cellvibrio sp. QJXJ]UUA71073.1 polymorphic toxin type 15 domain-containing protein [Cellvibrio sp. QJXJ]